MSRKSLLALFSIFILGVLAVVPVAAQDEFIFGMILVGPQNDRGWSQAHFEGGQYVEQNVPGAKMIVFEKLNPADAPETTLKDVVSEMVDQGAKLIITSSDAFEEDTTKVAAEFPDVWFINDSGDDAYTGEAPANVGNLMPQMEWMEAIGGCAAALTTQTGNIGFLGPLINFETRRYAVASYLGAKYCYENYREMDSELQFTVTWIGFWFNIPGVTLDPTEESNAFFDNGADVVISGIDTTEATTVTSQRSQEGEAVWVVPYDYINACDEAPEICIGVRYFNWGPSYVNIVNAIKDGTYTQSWDFAPPDWSDINNVETTAAGFIQGDALSDEAKVSLDDFISKMAAYATDEANADTIWLWEGPLNNQDGTALAAEGEKLPLIAPLGEAPSMWYTEQLLEGMVGASSQ